MGVSGPGPGSTQEVRDLHGLVKQAYEQLEEVRDELEKERRARHQLEREVEELRAELEDLDQRTDLLSLIGEEDVDGRAMQVALVQHLYREATRRKERFDKRPVASIGRDEAQRALHFPDVDRTTLYKWMQRAAGRVDGEVLRYEEGRMKINLEAGDLPGRFVTGGDL